MQVLRTPDDRFAAIPDYPFAPHYAQVTDAATGQALRLHYVDEGPCDAAPVLLMHGEPSWSFLYRHFVGPLTAAGHRVIAPDLIGFGKSDKPADRNDYSYERHVAWMADWLTGLDLSNITLFCQDWGGLDRAATCCGLSRPLCPAGHRQHRAPGRHRLVGRLFRLVEIQPVGAGISNRAHPEWRNDPRPDPGRNRRL